MSKFNIFTIDLRVILWIIVATGAYALLLKFLQKNSPHNVHTKERGGGAKGFLNNVKKMHFSCMKASLNHPFFNSSRCFTACSVLDVGELIFLVVVIDYDVATVLPCVNRA